MAGKLKTWSTTPGNNNQAAPNGWPEGMAPSSVNNTARQDRASVAEWYRDSEWVDFGDTIVTAAGQVYTISGDVTARYTVGRAIRQNGSSIGLITASSYSIPNTLVTVSGFVPSASPTSVELGASDKATSRLSSGTSAVDFSAYSGDIQLKVNGAQVGVMAAASMGYGTASPSNLGSGGTLTLLHIHNTGTGNSSFGYAALSSAATGNTAVMGAIAFGSTGLSGSDKRTAQIISNKRDALTVNPVGDLQFQTANGGVPATRLTIGASGNVDLATGALNIAQGSDIASAGTINLDPATGNVVNITGTTPISAITLTNGRQRVCRAVGSFTLTAGASLVILPGNFTQQIFAGDMLAVEAIGGVRYVRVFRASGGEFIATTGSLNAADNTITIPAGTWSRIRVAIRGLKANSDFWCGARINGVSTGTYSNAVLGWNPTAAAATGTATLNAVMLNQADTSAPVAFDSSSVTTNPVNGDVEILNPDATDHIDFRSRVQSRAGDAASFASVINGARYTANGPVTSVSLHLRTTFVAGTGLGATGVTPSAGTYQLFLTP